MSRHTRRLRRQARAKAAAQRNHSGFSGVTVLQDRPAATAPQSGHDHNRNHLAGSLGWTETERDVRDLPAPVQTLSNGLPSSRQPVKSPSTPLSPIPPALPQREVVPGTAPDPRHGQRRQPHNDRWLWRDKILLGDLAVLVGEEGSGKTRVLADWIARVTAGRAFPGTPDPSHALPPSDVLVFNSVDDFQTGVLDEVSANGGDPSRVWQATNQLLDWGHSHGEFPAGQLPEPGGAADDAPETRVRLHTQAILSKLRQFLLRRPSIRLVVIDQLKQHLRTDSERVFEEIIYDLQALAREVEVPFILTQRPDAFRNAIGTKQYFKSDSLTSVARSIWRVAQPEDPSHGHRVLQCLKLNHGYADRGKEPWRLWQEPNQPMRWEGGTGEEFPLGKLEAKQRILFHAKTFISLYLQMFGGLADFDTLRFWGRKEGITRSKLFEATMVYNLGYLFEPCAESETGLRQLIGSWDQIQRRQALAEGERSPLLEPPLPKRRKKPSASPTTAIPGGPAPGGLPAAAVAEVPAAPAVAARSAGTTSKSPPAVPSASPPLPPALERTPAQLLESLRARVARGEARLRQFDLAGFRFIKPNLTTCHMLLNMEAELGSEEAVMQHLREGLGSVEPELADDLESFLGEYRQLFQIAREVDAAGDLVAAA